MLSRKSCANLDGVKMLSNKRGIPARRRPLRCALTIFIAVAILGCAFVGITNSVVISSAKDRIIFADAAAECGADCAIVLGCLVRADGTPSNMLSDRLEVGCSLYEAGAVPKLLMSGDHGRNDYDEVGTMKDFAVSRGIASSDVFEDHAGFSTYETLYRAKEVFGCKKVVIVTQEYHLYRALYIAEKLGLEAWGVSADLRQYGGQSMRDVREVAARTKDCLSVLFHVKPKYLGDAIPISGNGDLSEG